MKRDTLVERFAYAIAKMEGFYRDLNKEDRGALKAAGVSFVDYDGKMLTPGQAYNNPGNIMVQWGHNRISKDGFVIFSTMDEGWKALKHQISLLIDRHLTFLQFFAGERDEKGRVTGYYGYAPAGHGVNNPMNYAAFVIDELGFDVPIMTKIEDMVDG
jgi:hypothetical protein